MNTQKTFPAWTMVFISMVISSVYFLYFEKMYWGNIITSIVCAYLLIILVYKLRKNKSREIYLVTASSDFRKKSKQYPLLFLLVLQILFLFASQVMYTLHPEDLAFSFVYICLLVLTFEMVTLITEHRTTNIGKKIINGLKKNPSINKLDWTLNQEGNKNILIFKCPNFTLLHIVRVLKTILYRCKYEVVVKDPVFVEYGCCYEKKVVEMILFKDKKRSVLTLECVGDVPEFKISFSV